MDGNRLAYLPDNIGHSIAICRKFVHTNTNPRTDSNLLTLDPRFERERIQCADSVGPCRRKVDPETFISEFRQTRLCKRHMSPVKAESMILAKG